MNTYNAATDDLDIDSIYIRVYMKLLRDPADISVGLPTCPLS